MNKKVVGRVAQTPFISGGTGAYRGKDGADGFSPIATVTENENGSVITITDKNGTTTATVLNGAKGETGERGLPGSPGSPGAKGDPGYTPVKGVDYFDGERGSDGAKGETGDSGVYIGTEAPTDPDKNVWIDTNGDSDSIDYNDLINKPTIPSKTSDLTNDSNFITNTYHDGTKVDKVEGKSLSSNDYNSTDKAKVDVITTNGDGNSYLANDGTYKAVQSGATYTAGTNIEITDDDIINNKIPYAESGNYEWSTEHFINSTLNIGESSGGQKYDESIDDFVDTIKSVAVGARAMINQDDVVAVGYDTRGFGSDSVAIGSGASANEKDSIALGSSAETYGDSSIAIGKGSISYGDSSIAIGKEAMSENDNEIVIGSSTSNINTAKIYTSDGEKELSTKEYVDEHSGSSYTAGTNIEITEDNVINSTVDLTNYATKTYVDDKIGNIDTLLIDIVSGGGVE